MSVAAGRPTGYSTAQIALHWTIAALILFQFLAHEGMEHVWDAFEDGEMVPSGDLPLAYAHVGVGITVLVLALIRLWLRDTRGAPPLPENDPPVTRFAAHATHGLLYLLILITPLSGAVAWFLGIEEAGDAHKALKSMLLLPVAVHVAGALFQQFVLKSSGIMRMLRPGA